MSKRKRVDRYDNVAMKSWNHSFKSEVIYGEQFLTRVAAKEHVFDYIDVYYNRERLHSGLGYFRSSFYLMFEILLSLVGCP